MIHYLQSNQNTLCSWYGWFHIFPIKYLDKYSDLSKHSSPHKISTNNNEWCCLCWQNLLRLSAMSVEHKLPMFQQQSLSPSSGCDEDPSCPSVYHWVNSWQSQTASCAVPHAWITKRILCGINTRRCDVYHINPWWWRWRKSPYWNRWSHQKT
jgi:hypothetical protein